MSTERDEQEVLLEDQIEQNETSENTDEVNEPAEVDVVQKATEEYKQKLLRLQADFDNFRRRTQKEREDAAKYAALSTITKILPALDNLDRAIQASKQSQDFETLAKGVEMTAKLLLEGLQQEGLQAMECVGQLFNPEFHQAVMQIESDEYEEGAVVEELQKGYILKDKVIRPAMVKVNKA